MHVPGLFILSFVCYYFAKRNVSEGDPNFMDSIQNRFEEKKKNTISGTI